MAAQRSKDRDKVRKLARLVADLRRGEDFPITRLTSLKSLCEQPPVANRFAAYLARKTLERTDRGRGRSGGRASLRARGHRQLMAEALAGIEACVGRPSEGRRERLRDLLHRMRDEQNEYKPMRWGSVRVIHDRALLVCEYAASCVLNPREASYWAYQIARLYAERYDPRYGTALIPESAPLVRDIVDFWAGHFHFDPSVPPAPAAERQSKPSPDRVAGDRTSTRPGRAETPKAAKRAGSFTHRQGQFLAFIHLYRTLHRRGPAEADLATYFRLTPPAVHSMVVRLRELGLLTRDPAAARSLRVAIPEADIPRLETVEGPPW